MSTSTSARNAAENSRRPSTASGAKFRGPSSRVAGKERPFSSGEVIPEDSASNAPSKRTVSEAHKVNGGSRTVSERQTGRSNVATRETLQVRTRSPFKVSSNHDSASRSPQESIRPRSRTTEGQAPQPKKEKKALRESQ